MNRRWIPAVAGAGIELLLIALFAVTTSRQVTRLYSELSTTDSMIQSLEAELSGLRADIYLSGIYVRNQLLSAQSEWSDDQRNSLREVRVSMEDRLRRISALVSHDQAAKIEELRREIDDYWKVLDPVAADPRRATANGRTVREHLRTRRDSALTIAEQIREINQTIYAERQEQIAAAQTRLTKYIWTMTVVAVCLGVIVMIASGYMVVVLQRRSERNRERVKNTETELRRLSCDLFQTQEQERRHLSRELHDEVGQTLTALGMELGNIERLYPAATPEFAHHVDEAKRLTQDTIKTVRRMAMGLRPAMLDDSGLAPALRYLAREFSRRHGIPAVVEIRGNLGSLPDAYRTCVYRVVQEALTNCARHARASNVRITLEEETTRVTLRVEDDGVGLSKRVSSGMGLIGMGERARELLGTVTLTPGNPHGTVLRLDLPLPLKAAV
jgi:signal transduction histidine kinase